jgi:hypothetical protein
VDANRALKLKDHCSLWKSVLQSSSSLAWTRQLRTHPKSTPWCYPAEESFFIRTPGKKCRWHTCAFWARPCPRNCTNGNKQLFSRASTALCAFSNQLQCSSLTEPHHGANLRQYTHKGLFVWNNFFSPWSHLPALELDYTQSLTQHTQKKIHTPKRKFHTPNHQLHIRASMQRGPDRARSLSLEEIFSSTETRMYWDNS